jgi:hypothetical protein
VGVLSGLEDLEEAEDRSDDRRELRDDILEASPVDVRVTSRPVKGDLGMTYSEID